MAVLFIDCLMMKNPSVLEIEDGLECDQAFFDEVDHRIGCFDDDGNFLRYRDIVQGVEIYIVYIFSEKEYQAFFRKFDDTFQPHETSFTAKTWEVLMQHVESEMRLAAFSQFLGILAKRKVIDTIRLKGGKIFSKLP